MKREKANQDIRKAIFDSGLYQYEIADALGIREENLCKLLRKELPQEEKEKILKVIELAKA